MKPKVRVEAFIKTRDTGLPTPYLILQPPNFPALGPHRKTKPVFGARNVQNAIIAAVASWQKFRPWNTMKMGSHVYK